MGWEGGGEVERCAGFEEMSVVGCENGSTEDLSWSWGAQRLSCGDLIDAA